MTSRRRLAPRHLLSLSLAALVACSGERAAPPVLQELPPFELRDQSGEPFRSEELRGHVWIGNAIFTNCPSVCPLMTAQMANLTRRLEDLGDRVHFVSFSVDPEHDTPARMREYAEAHEADFARWHFLTGERPALEAAIEGGLRIPMGAPEPGGDIGHGTHFVLVDQRGRHRGFYRTEGAGLENLAQDARLLATPSE